MITITLPDGSRREFDQPVTVADVAASIGAGLAKAALAGRIGSGGSARLADTSHRIESDQTLAIVTQDDVILINHNRPGRPHLLQGIDHHPDIPGIVRPAIGRIGH